MNPSVCAVCLTADRQKMTERAVTCFLGQKYYNASLLILDTGTQAFDLSRLILTKFERRRIVVIRADRSSSDTIGGLRNLANGFIKSDIIAHWDSDDWSHSKRLFEQVQQLTEGQAKGISAVGYHDMLFWERASGEAWAYHSSDRSMVLGTSLTYWRSAWEETPFPEKHIGEDGAWVRQVKRWAFPSYDYEPDGRQPLMVAEVHGSNTSSRIHRNLKPPDDRQWIRQPAYDGLCSRVMALA